VCGVNSDQNKLLHIGQVELLDDLNQVNKQLAWYLFLHVGHARLGKERSFMEMILERKKESARAVGGT
jgi:hypothetical protein